jgi:hypothetical protein
LTYRNKGVPGQHNERPLMAAAGRHTDTQVGDFQLSIKVIAMDDYCTLCGRRGHSASHCPWGSYMRIRRYSPVVLKNDRSLTFRKFPT